MASATANLTLQQFARQIAAGPTPAAVAVSATTAAFALQLAAMALQVSARHRDFAGAPRAFAQLNLAARNRADDLMRLADEDSAAFNEYLTCLRMPRNTAAERAARQRAAGAALRRAIEIPLAVAHTALDGLESCVQAADGIHQAVAADLAGAATLLSGSIAATLLSVDANLRRLMREDEFYRTAVAQRQELETRSSQACGRIRTILCGALGSA